MSQCLNPACDKEADQEGYCSFLCKRAGEVQGSPGGRLGRQRPKQPRQPDAAPVVVPPMKTAPMVRGQREWVPPNGWTRPKYWQRLRDLDETLRQSFGTWLRKNIPARFIPKDPNLPSAEQDFYQPWQLAQFQES